MEDNFGKVEYYRIVKYGSNLFVIIEPERGFMLRDKETMKLLTFKNKDKALSYCEKMGYKVGEEYL